MCMCLSGNFIPQNAITHPLHQLSGGHQLQTRRTYTPLVARKGGGKARGRKRLGKGKDVTRKEMKIRSGWWGIGVGIPGKKRRRNGNAGEGDEHCRQLQTLKSPDILLTAFPDRLPHFLCCCCIPSRSLTRHLPSTAAEMQF